METVPCQWCGTYFVIDGEYDPSHLYVCTSTCQEKHQAFQQENRLWNGIASLTLNWFEGRAKEEDLKAACRQFQEHRAKWEQALYGDE